MKGSSPIFNMVKFHGKIFDEKNVGPKHVQGKEL